MSRASCPDGDTNDENKSVPTTREATIDTDQKSQSESCMEYTDGDYNISKKTHKVPTNGKQMLEAGGGNDRHLMGGPDTLDSQGAEKGLRQFQQDCEQLVLARHHRATGQSIQLEFQGQQQDSKGDKNKPKRNPYCSRCRNHGKSVQVKGHKRHCEYRDCQCEGCKLVECRQIVSAAQIRRRRYQKQDEECGRRIEVSPPVLARQNRTDPAALIARTLIGCTSPQHLRTISPTVPDSPVDAMSSKISNSANSCGSARPLGAARISPDTLNTHQLYMQLKQTHQNSSNSLQAMDRDTMSSVMASFEQPNLANTSNRQQAVQVDGLGGYQYAHSNALGAPVSAHNGSVNIARLEKNISAFSGAANATRLNDAQNSDMFRLSKSLYPTSSTLKPVNITNPPIPSPSIVARADSKQFISSPSSRLMDDRPFNAPILSTAGRRLPSAAEQMRLVDEIYRAFGSQAIYAWLLAEHFDLDRVRSLIEFSRPSFNELLNSESVPLEAEHRTCFEKKVCLDPYQSQLHGGNQARLASSSNGASGSISGSTSRSSSIDNGSSGSSCDRIFVDHTVNDSAQQLMQRTNPARLAINGERSYGVANGSAVTSATSSLTSSLTQAFSLARDGPQTAATSAVKCIGDTLGPSEAVSREQAALTSMGAQAAAAAAAALTANSSPSTGGILWPNFKLTNQVGPISSNPLLHPHLLPHFMHHHHNSFMAHRLQQQQQLHHHLNHHHHHHHHHNQQQQHQQHTQYSSILANQSLPNVASVVLSGATTIGHVGDSIGDNTSTLETVRR